jgi:cytidylate kinase
MAASSLPALSLETAWTPEEPKLILFSGLTASAKTTYSHLAANEFNRSWLDATTLLKSLAGLTHVPNNELWVTDAADEIQEAREGDMLDRQLDEQLLQQARDNPGAVIDAWALPWLWEGDAVRIFVESDLDTRVQRCMGSLAVVGEDSSAAAAEKLITEKDTYTRDLFHRLYGFDIFVDREIFDCSLDTSGFVPDTVEKRGVDIATERLFPIVRTAIIEAGGTVATPVLRSVA